jgi:regulatory protein YycH of two-component signal transduction system YycFG
LKGLQKGLILNRIFFIYNETNQEREKYLLQSKEQKQKFKTILIENVDKLCAIIDEQL